MRLKYSGSFERNFWRKLPVHSLCQRSSKRSQDHFRCCRHRSLPSATDMDSSEGTRGGGVPGPARLTLLHLPNNNGPECSDVLGSQYNRLRGSCTARAGRADTHSTLPCFRFSRSLFLIMVENLLRMALPSTSARSERAPERGTVERDAATTFARVATGRPPEGANALAEAITRPEAATRRSMDGMVPRVGGLTRPTFSVWVARDRIAPKLERTAQAPEFEPTAGKIMVPVER